MKSPLIPIILSILLVSSISNSYGDFFITTSDGSTAFDRPWGIAVDSNDRIIVADYDSGLVQIYDSTGSFIGILDAEVGGGTAFENPFGIAVDSEDRIIVSDSGLVTVQIFDSTGTFVDILTGGIAFSFPTSIAVDNDDRIIVIDQAINTVQIYNPDGTFFSSFDVGNDDPFSALYAVAVDSMNRIIVSDYLQNTVQIYTSEGEFFASLSGGATFDNPYGIAVDSSNNIFVTDAGLDKVQIYDPAGSFLTSFDGTDGGTQFDDPRAIVIDSDNRIIVADDSGLIQIFNSDGTFITSFDGSEDEEPDDPPKRGGGGCNDCTPPTLGLDKNFIRLVDNGFSYNGNSIQVEKWHTPFPLINATVGEMNTVEIIIYENQGVNNIKLVQFGLGATEIGQPLNDLEVLIEVWLDINNNNFAIEEIVINDEDNLIESSSVSAVADVVKCMSDSNTKVCLKVTLQYSYREATINNVMLVNAADKYRNSQNFYFNEGINVLGESLNEPPTYILQNKRGSQQTEDLTLTLTRTDKVNNIWTDNYGIEYLQISDDRFDRIPIKDPVES